MTGICCYDATGRTCLMVLLAVCTGCWGRKCCVTKIRDVVSQLAAIAAGIILHCLLTRCSENVSVDGSWGGRKKKKKKLWLKRIRRGILFFSLIRYNSSVEKKIFIKMLMLPSAQAGVRLWVGFDPSDLRTFLGSGFVLLPLCFCLRRRPKKLPNTQQQLQQTENISQSEDVGRIPLKSDSSTAVWHRLTSNCPVFFWMACTRLNRALSLPSTSPHANLQTHSMIFFFFYNLEIIKLFISILSWIYLPNMKF